MSKTKSFAKKELDLLVKSFKNSDDKPIIQEFIPEILSLVDKFGRSGQSGSSAPYVARALSDAINKLCLQEPISPITGDDSEWSKDFQNNRCSALFKDSKDGGAYYLNAIIWQDQDGYRWSAHAKLKNGDTVGGMHYIKGFPFEPKTFYVDVIERNGDFYVKDESQLDQVWEYYNKRNK